MSNLLVVAFPSEQQAEQGRRKLLLENENLVATEDAVIAVKKADGTIKLSQLAQPGPLWEIRAAADPLQTPMTAISVFPA
jgi:uncharacterized membrane protein